MASYTQQEELEQLKIWWKNYGASLVIGVLLGIALLVGYRYWTQYREAQREAASALYDQMLGELRANKKEMLTSGETLVNQYTSTPYAAMAALLLARQAYGAGDTARARQHLEWALKNADDVATRHAARLRLARLILDAGDAQAAGALLDAKNVTGFEAEYDDLRGDVAIAKGEKDVARAAYRNALVHMPAGSSYAGLIAMKLDALGPEKAQ